MAARLSLLILGAAIPALASAEVMDKEFGLLVVAAVGVIAVVMAFAAARWLPWALVVVVPAVAYVFAIQLSELVDPHVGPAILREAGPLYVGVSWTLPILAVVAVIVGFAVRRARANAAI
jgi:hypothetical protein